MLNLVWTIAFFSGEFIGQSFINVEGGLGGVVVFHGSKLVKDITDVTVGIRERLS